VIFWNSPNAIPASVRYEDLEVRDPDDRMRDGACIAPEKQRNGPISMGNGEGEFQAVI